MLKLRKNFVAVVALVSLASAPAWPAHVIQSKCDWFFLKLVTGGKIPEIIEVRMQPVDDLLPGKLTAKANSNKTGIALQKGVRDLIKNRIVFEADIPSEEIIQLLKPGQRYTYLLLSDRVYIAPTGSAKLDDILSKHRLLAGGSDDVRFGGELWLDENGVLHLNNGSGTFTPPTSGLDQLRLAFQRTFNTTLIQTHEFVPPTLAQTIKDGGLKGKVSDIAVGIGERVKDSLIKAITPDLSNRSAIVFQRLTADGVKPFTIETGKRYGVGMGAAVYKVNRVDGLPEVYEKLGTDKLVMKVSHRLKEGKPAIRFFEKKMEREIEIYEALIEQIRKIEGDPGFPKDTTWNSGSVPTLSYFKVDTDQSMVMFKPELTGMDLKSLKESLNPDDAGDLPPEMLASLKEIYDFAQAAARQGTVKKSSGGTRPMYLDINPTNLIWVSDPQMLKVLGMKRPGFYFYEFGELPSGIYEGYTRDFDTYVNFVVSFMNAAR